MTTYDARPTIPDCFGTDSPTDGHTDDSPTPPARAKAWFLGEAPAPADEPSDEAGRSAMAAEAAQLPLLQVTHHLLEFVGDGCRATKTGALFAIDRRRIGKRWNEESGGRSWLRHHTEWQVADAWVVLTDHGWLTVEDGWARPTGKPLVSVGSEAATDEELEGTRQLLAAVLESASVDSLRHPFEEEPAEDLWDALLVASGPEGLVLPDLPRDSRLLHCAESVSFLVGLVGHPYVREVPLDHASGHIADSALHRLARTSQALAQLSGWGVLTDGGKDLEAWEEYWYEDDAPGSTSAQTYRAPVLMRGAVALVRERREA